MNTEPPAPPPETKDWTFVVDQACAECGFDPATVDVHAGFAARIRAAAASLAAAATAPGGRQRPEPVVWSPLEYAAHGRDVCAVFLGRVEQMRADDGARFANWDQDAAALEGRYWELDPATVAADLTGGAATIAESFASLAPDAWSHRGFRSNGSVFTVETLGRYFLHDLEHHVHDVRR